MADDRVMGCGIRAVQWLRACSRFPAVRIRTPARSGLAGACVAETGGSPPIIGRSKTMRLTNRMLFAVAGACALLGNIPDLARASDWWQVTTVDSGASGGWGVRLDCARGYAFRLRRRRPANARPISPRAASAKVEGSGITAAEGMTP